MFPLEGNDERPYRKDSFESWHQALPRPPRPTQNPDRYKWDDISALFKDQVRMVSVSHSKRIGDSKAAANKPKGKKLHPPGNIKLKRLSKTKAGGKRFDRSAVSLSVSSKGKKWGLKPGKRGNPGTSPFQDTKKKFMKAIISATKSHK